MNRREILRYTAYFAGAALSAPVASALLTGCKRDAEVVAGTAEYAPGFFTSEEFEFITRFSDTLLPETDTPGAISVGAHEMVDKMVGQVYAEEDRLKFRKGLTALMARMDADNVGDGGFSKLENDKALVYLQDQDLHYMEPGKDWKTGPAAEADAQSAYTDLKNMIVGAYFNSEPVATTMLAYDPVPGAYIPCGDLQELTGGKAWAI